MVVLLIGIGLLLVCAAGWIILVKRRNDDDAGFTFFVLFFLGMGLIMLGIFADTPSARW